MRRGLDLLREGGVPFALLSVVNFESNALEVHEHFCELGPDHISYLMPHCTHDDIADVNARYGPTPCLDWLGPVLDDWWQHGTLQGEAMSHTTSHHTPVDPPALGERAEGLAVRSALKPTLDRELTEQASTPSAETGGAPTLQHMASPGPMHTSGHTTDRSCAG